MRNATCAASKTSKVPTQDALLFISYSMTNTAPSNTFTSAATEYWRDDVWFGAQFLNGSNPEVIRKCKQLPSKFPVKDEMVAKLLDRGYDLNRAMQVRAYSS